MTCSRARPAAPLTLLIVAALLLNLAAPVSGQMAGSVSFLPMIFFPDPTQVSTLFGPSAFGMVMSSITPERGLDGVVDAGAAWVRSNNGLIWRDVEPVEGGGYRWDAPSVQVIEQEMIRASENHLKLIMVVRSSPRWATAPYAVDCAPINPSKYARFAAFVAAAVERYSRPPYNVVFWQIGNEPDAYIFPQDSGFGCWGLPSDPYYGGRAYGDMLKAVYPAIKAASPDAQVLNGSLLLSGPYEQETGTNLSARFIEGVFVAGAADSFDILAFNAFYWAPDTKDWKAKYLRKLLDAYHIPQKPMITTEMALLCNKSGENCRQAHARVLGAYYARALSQNLIGALWYIYDSDSFHFTALVDPSNVSAARPGYLAYRHAALLLGGARYIGPLEGQPADVEGYRFSKAGAAITVFWSTTPQTVTLPLTLDTAVECTAFDGQPILCDTGSGSMVLPAGGAPTYVVTHTLSL